MIIQKSFSKILLLTLLILIFLPLHTKAQIVCTCQDNTVIPQTQITSCVECPGKCATLGGVHATIPCTNVTGGTGTGGTPSGPAPKYSLEGADPLNLQTGSGRNVVTLASTVIMYVLGFVGATVFIAFLYGGTLIIFSAGNPKRVGAGKNVLVYSVIGLAIIFFSYAVLNLFFDTLKSGVIQ